MSFVPLALALACVVAVGWALIRPVTMDLSRPERFAWAGATGLLALVTSSAALMAFGLQPGPKKLAVVGAALVVLSRMSWGVRSPAIELEARESRTSLMFAAFLGVIAVCAVLLFAVEATRSPMWLTDHLMIWGLKARVIFGTSTIPARLFNDPALFWSHPEYPLMVPLTLSSLAAVTRSWDSRSLALIYPFLQALTILAVGGYLGRRMSWAAGATGGALLALCANLYSVANVGTADIPVAFGFVLLATGFLDVVNSPSRSGYARLALAALFATSTKMEGALFPLLLAATALITGVPTGRQRWRLLGCLLIPVAAHAGTMQLFRGHVSARDVDWSLLSLHRLPEMGPRIQAVVRRLYDVELRQAVVPLLCIIIVLLLTRRQSADVLLWPIALQILAYTAACVLSAIDPTWQLASAFSRLVVSLFPVTVLVIVGRLFAPRARPSPVLRTDENAMSGGLH